MASERDDRAKAASIGAGAPNSAAPDPSIQKKVEELIEAEEGAANRIPGWLGQTIAGFAILVSLFHLYAAYEIVPAYVMRPVHVFCVMFLAFLLYPIARRYRDRVMWWDWLLAASCVGVIGYILWQGDTFGDRAVVPERMDVWVGIV